MSYDAGLVARMADALRRIARGPVRQKNVFGGRGFLVASTTFAIASGDGLIVKTPPDEYEHLLHEPGVTPFAPGGERPMTTWVVVDADVIADDPALAEWLERGLRAIGR